MITTRTSPQYVNRVRQDWTANGGVYGDGGISALVPSNDPFAQLGPTLDLTFAGVPTDQLAAPTTDGYSINLNLSSEIYQIAAQYVVWGTGGLTQVNFADIVTFTRASTATYFNSAGTLTSAAINEARFDYDPSTLAPQGLLIEESRTNSIRNNTMQGAVAGTPGTLPTDWVIIPTTGLSTSIIGVGTEDGISYVDIRLFGTAGSASTSRISFDSTTGIAGLTGQTWTSSVYWRLVGGNWSNISAATLRLVERTSAGVLVRDNTSSTLTLATSNKLSTQKPTYTVTTSGGATVAAVQPSLNITPVNGVAIDITLRIGLPQLELGAFATSVIPTTTTALTRSADVASVNTLSPWYNASAGTLFAEYNIPVAVQNQAAAALSDGTNNNRMLIRAANTSAQTIFIGVATAATQWTGVVVTAPTNATTKSSFAYATNDIAWVRNAGTVGTDATATIPTVTGLKLGADGDGALPLNGYLRRITYYPRRLANADLQTLTT